jgi:hypothetical protein
MPVSATTASFPHAASISAVLVLRSQVSYGGSLVTRVGQGQVGVLATTCAYSSKTFGRRSSVS